MISAEGGRHTRVAFASELGCRLNVDLLTGRNPAGGPASDDTDVLNAFLATASARHPIKLFLDGPALVRGLVISPEGNTTIEGLGWGTGLFVADGANSDAIRIGRYTGGYGDGQGVRPVPERTARNIVLRDFQVNGNGRRNATGDRQGLTPANQPVPGAPVHAVFGISLVNCREVSVENVRVNDAPCYGILIANACDVNISRCAFYSGAIFQDGVHIDGPTERVLVHGCSFSTGDDGVAVNAPEGYGGDITDVRVTDCVATAALTLMRVYTSIRGGTPWSVRGVVVANCTGSTKMAAFNLGLEGGSADPTPGRLEQMQISNCVLSSPGFATVQTPIGTLSLTDCTLFAPWTDAPFLLVASFGARELSLKGVQIWRNRMGHASPPLVHVPGNAALGRLVLADVKVVDEMENVPPIPFLVNAEGVIGALRVDSAEMDHVAALAAPASGWARVGRVYGAGLLGTGARVPEAVAGENATFVSAESGVPSVKTKGGVRQL